MKPIPISVVVVPRERFSETRASLESLYTHSAGVPFELVYVDGGSPRGVRRYLEHEQRVRGFRLLRTPGYLSPNHARNVGLRAAHGEYVVFVDNDVIVQPGWLQALFDCAEQTGAWVVGPVVCIGRPPDDVIHITRGDLRFVERDGRRELEDAMVGINERLREIEARLQRQACDFVEFHCMLVRREPVSAIGLDEQMLSTREHIDFCLSVKQAGGTIYFEPRARVTHVPPWCGFKLSDLPFYLVRWNDRWAQASISHFRKKWDLPPEAQDRMTEWIQPHRRIAFDHLSRVLVPPGLRHYASPAMANLLERAYPAIADWWVEHSVGEEPEQGSGINRVGPAPGSAVGPGETERAAPIG